MKLLPFITLFFIGHYAFAQQNIIASSCHANGGRCTGSAYCSACSNCSRCAHCNAGGTCGVCSGSATESYSKPAKARSASRTTRKETRVPVTVPGNYVLVKSEELNLREGPGTNYDILEKLTMSQKLIVLSLQGDWLNVRVANTGTQGYVHKNYVK